MTHHPERLRCSGLPTGSGLPQNLEGFLRREDSAAESLCFPAEGVREPPCQNLNPQNAKGLGRCGKPAECTWVSELQARALVVLHCITEVTTLCPEAG